MQGQTPPKIKTPKQLERYFKGAASHWRIRILLLLADQPSLSLIQIAEAVNGNMKTIAEHTARLHRAGLVDKQYKGRMVLHNLSPYGQRFITFFTKF